MVYPAERNRFTGELIMKITQIRKMNTNEEIGMNVIVIHPIKIVVPPTMIKGNVIIITKTTGNLREIGMIIGNREMKISVNHLLVLLKMKRMMTEKKMIRIIIIGKTGEIAIGIELIGIDVGNVIGKEIDDMLGMTGQKIGIEKNVLIIIRRKIVRGRDPVRGIVYHNLE